MLMAVRSPEKFKLQNSRIPFLVSKDHLECCDPVAYACSPSY
jgi:hypothetical protein